MRVLVVDEDPRRLEAFAVKHEQDEVTIAETITDALVALSSASFDLVLLTDSLQGNPIAGNVITRYIASTMPVRERPRAVVIHTANPIAAGQMRTTLKLAGVRVDWKPCLEALLN
jgi:CheY-like chemotaxis protein